MKETHCIFFAPFPLEAPTTGGQIRTSWMLKTAEKIFRSVHKIEVIDEKNWPDMSDINANALRFIVNSDHNCRSQYDNYARYCSDLHLYAWSLNNEAIVNQIIDSIVLASCEYLVIWIEYPWLIKLALKTGQLIEKHYGIPVKLVYSSGNIEHEVYDQILKSRHIQNLDGLVDLIKKIEKYAVLNSDISIACSEYDKKIIINLFNRHSLLAPNGVSRTQYSIKHLAFSGLTSELCQSKYLFYAASDWPPNTDAVAKYLGECLGFVPPDCKLVVAGGASRVFSELYLNESSKYFSINKHRIVILGKLNDIDFKAAHALAYGYFLPVGYGGGTCLKTAEAIYSNKVVVASPAALRGYDLYFNAFRHLISASDANSFTKSIQEALSGKFDTRVTTNTLVSKLEKLTWEAIIHDLQTDLISELKL